MTPAEQVSQRLEALPDLRRYFDAVIERLARRDGLGVALSGSLAGGAAGGTIDRWSDLDLELFVGPDATVAETVEWMRAEISALGPLLTRFPATHLGLDDLWIFFFCAGDAVVKIDAWVLERAAIADFPDALLVLDPGGHLAAVRAAGRPTPRPAPDFEDLHAKMTGWIWYTATKIDRGEILEAIDGLGVMRGQALLPCLQLVDGLPFEGHRRLEIRLGPARLARLHATYPAALNRRAVMEALLALAGAFAEVQPDVASRLGRDHRRGDLAGMIELVERLAAVSGRDLTAGPPAPITRS
jgi:hypothetical protein